MSEAGKRSKAGAFSIALFAVICLSCVAFAAAPAHADDLQTGMVVAADDSASGSSASAGATDAAASGEAAAKEDADPTFFTATFDAQYGQTEARRMLDMVNEFRQSDDAWTWNADNTEKTYAKDLKPLTYDYGLEKSAMLRAAELALYASYSRPNGSSLFDMKPLSFMESAKIGSETVEDAFEAFKEENAQYDGQYSRRNMLDGYSSVAFGHIYVNGTHYWTQEYSYFSSGTEETLADDSEQRVSIEVDPSLLTDKNFVVNPSSITLFEGGSTGLPEINGVIGTDSMVSSTPMPVAVTPGKWTVADPNVATIEDGQLKAQGLGTTTLVAILGTGEEEGTSEKLEIPITVKKCEMYRLYNARSGEHFYTSNPNEKDNLVGVGWQDEGVGWIAPTTSDTPVYRLYNPYAGEHHYTMSADERDMLVEAGWNDEGIGWYSDDAKGKPLYRDYNPNAFANNHNYTADTEEHKSLMDAGWQDEGLAWYGLA